ncbi:MAG TPA: tetratricopeptide repeat protein [bacterium]|nr:tetratricopeptide repeat protein [bacterium]
MRKITVICLLIAFAALADVDPDAEITTTDPDVPGEEGTVLSSEVRAQLEESADSYLQVAEENLHSPDIAGEMLFKAGECYEKLGDWTKAREIFTLYNQRYRETGVPDLVVESYYRAGHAALKLGDVDTGRDLLFECTKVYEDFSTRPGIEVNFDIPAKAYVEIGDLLFDDYAAITLEGDLMDLDPLVQTATKKYGLMNELTEIYGRAARASDLEVNFSARYKAGLVYEQFYRTVSQMKLSFATLDQLMEENPDEAAELEETVMEQLAEFKSQMNTWAAEKGLDKAIQVYEFIIRSAEERGETNQWVQMAEERLADLIP